MARDPGRCQVRDRARPGATHRRPGPVAGRGLNDVVRRSFRPPMLNLASKMRPYLGAVVLTVGLLTAGGIYSATQMPSSVYPEVTFPRIAVVAKVAGLAVPNMDVQVTQPLEQAVTTVIGVAQVRSKTIRGGSELSIDFNAGTDMRRAETMTWNRIGAIRSQLPGNVEITVDQMTPSVFPIMSLVLTGADNPSQLRDYAFYQLAP